MVDGDLFDKLEAIAREVRGNAAPFGGIQLVLSGDFHQLPPVPKVFPHFPYMHQPMLCFIVLGIYFPLLFLHARGYMRLEHLHA